MDNQVLGASVLDFYSLFAGLAVGYVIGLVVGVYFCE